MLEVRSTVKLDEIETVLRAAAQRHNSSVVVISHLAPLDSQAKAAGQSDAFVFTFCHSKLYSALISADARFATFLPWRVAAWSEGSGVMLQGISPVEYCRFLGRPDLEHLAAPLETQILTILEDAARGLTVAARARTGPSQWGATEDQVNMAAALPQRIDCRGTKLEDEGGTGTHDAQGG
ncbi:MAG: hypothetical protein U0Q18_03245 [Bryobacteraceae bacterium]